MSRVAILGTGTMGAGMARSLLRAGHEVRAWNRTAARAEALASDGAEVYDSPEAAASGVDAVITMLVDADATAGVMRALLPVLPPAAVWIQMGTVGVAGTDRLAAMAREAGVQLVDAPVSGTKEPAEAGKLVVLASGSDGVHGLCDPLFAAMGQKTIWIGSDPGLGTRLKLVVNEWLLGVVLALAEAVGLARGLGLDPAVFLDAIAGGPLDAPYAGLKGRAMIAEDFPPSFPLALALKDARLVAAAGSDAGVPLRVTPAAIAAFEAAMDDGHGDEDLAAVFTVFRPSDGAGGDPPR